MNDVALITGASGGIGEALAREHARHGGDLVLVARSEDKLEAIAAALSSEFGVTVRVRATDLSRADQVDNLIAWLAAERIDVDILINNAGFGLYGLFAETEWEREAMMIDLNVRALTHLTKRLLPPMIARGRGRILNVASTASFQPGPLMAVYFATKHYVLALSEALSNETNGTGVTVTALCPGPTASGFQAAADLDESRIVRGRSLPTSEEVARFGYRRMLAGRPVAVHGLMNRIMAFSVRFFPRGMVTAMVRRMQES